MEWIKRLLVTKNQRIFLDYASATPVRASVRKAMEKYWSSSFHNPSAIYAEGVEVKAEMDDCRARVAKILGASQKEIIFTASGTESINLAILGAFEDVRDKIKKPHIIISEIEHSAVLRSAEEVVRRGGELSILPVNSEGLISPEQFKLALKPSTFMVSVGLANSEIGTIEPVAKIGRIIREYRKERGVSYPLFHTDASSAFNYQSVGLEKLLCDLLTLDGSKIYAPKGVGVLVVRRQVKLRPIVVGGGQERGLRAGTLNPALIAGFTLALELAEKERVAEVERLGKLRQGFIELVLKNVPSAIINGSEKSNLPNIVSISLPGVLAEFMLLKLDTLGMMVSVGTACSLDERISGSPVIRAIGKPELAESTLRISFGLPTTESEVKKAAEIFCRESRNMLK